MQVRVLGDNGTQLGVMKTRDALNMALDRGLDLVEIAPNAEIPVCRITDYGKFKFEKSKREKEAKKRQNTTETKEVQLSARIDTHDFNTRLKYAKKFIEAGDKVKVSLEFNKGREMAHMEIGYQTLERFEEACLEFAIVEKRPLREGRKVSMFIAPKKETVAAANAAKKIKVNENEEVNEDVIEEINQEINEEIVEEVNDEIENDIEIDDED